MVRHRERRRWLLFALCVVIVIIVNLPIITMILNSFRSTGEILSSTSMIPSKISFENYIYLNTRTPFWLFFRNSIIVSIGGTAATIAAATLAGYALSRYSSRLTKTYSSGLLLVQMFPIILALIPLFIMFRILSLTNTHLSVIMLYTVVHLPFATWMFRSYFDAIPRDLEEAAQIDGCSRIQGFLRVILPISGPGIAAVSIFSFLFSYNEFLVANIFLKKQELWTVPVGIQMFIQQYSSDWGSLMASATLAMIPTFIFFLFVQKFMVYGAMAGGVKG